MKATDKLMPLFKYVVLTLCVLASGIAHSKPQVQDGLLDLSEWNFSDDGVIELNGDWQFYWGKHLDSDLIRLEELRGVQPELVEVPGNWNATEKFSNLGFATYRLEVLVQEQVPLALKLRTVGTAFKLFIDGEELSSAGIAGQSEVTTTPQYRSKIVPFTPKSQRVELIFQVSNFDHRNAGLWEVILLGGVEDIRDIRQSRLSADLMLFGAIVMMAFYNLITWLTRRENLSGLWLGLFCLVLSTRILLVDERYISNFTTYFSWSTEIRFEYISWFLSIPIFLAFIRSMFPTETSQLVLRCLWAFAGVFTALCLVLPNVHVTALVPPYQVLTLFGIGYGAYCILLAIWRRKEGSILFGCGSVFLFLAAASDIATVVFTLDADNQLQTGLFLFVLLQSIQVSVRSSRAFQTVEAQSSELRKTNLELHIQEKLRRTAEGETQALHAQVTESMRHTGFGVVAEAVADRQPDGDSHIAAVAILRDLAHLLRGENLSREALELDQEADRFFLSEACKELKSECPLVEVSAQFESSEGHFQGSSFQLETLLYHLLRYSLRTQIHAQQVKISGHADYVYAGGLFHHQVSDGRYYIVSIEDQGQGIRPEDLVEIFDLEQKANGYRKVKPMLRDLAIAWTILEDHGGALDLHSLADSTRLELYFPITDS
jgi:signal transduction histidine kinase